MDAAGAVFAWIGSRTPGIQVVHASDFSKITDLGLAEWSDTQPHLDDAGDTILFLSTPVGTDNPQVYLMNIDGTNRRAVTAEPDGIAQAVLSGNGLVAWALTSTGRLLQFDLVTLARTQYTPPLAAFLKLGFNLIDPADRFFDGAVHPPGDIISVGASVMPGENIQVIVQGQPATIVNVSPQSVTFQIPANPLPAPVLPAGSISIRKPDSPSWTGDQLMIPLPPRFQPALVAAIHQDFSAPVTTAQPAYPDEIVHLYGIGFGPVTPIAPPNAPAPLSPLSHTVYPVTCDVLNAASMDTGPASVLFAGLAPSMVGVYQIDAALPNPLPSGASIKLSCSVANAGAQIAVPVGAPTP